MPGILCLRQMARCEGQQVPTVSVLMPAYNGAEYLPTAIDSILAQRFDDFELLILDDGSTDETPAILRKYAAEDRRIRTFSRTNRGLVASLNELLAHAQGRYVARMDADDSALPDRLSQQIRFLEEHPEVVCVGGFVEFIDDQGRFLKKSTYPPGNKRIQERLLAGFTAICHPTALMRRDSLVRVGGYDEKFSLAEDLDLWLRLGEVGELANVEEVVLRYRLHAASVSERAGARQLEVARAACERAWQRRGVQGQFKAGAWRAGSDRSSQYDYLLEYGWWAWSSREARTALSYAIRAIGLWPTRRGGWSLLGCSLFRPLKLMIDKLKGSDFRR